MITKQYTNGWYISTVRINTRYNTIATASGYGNTHAQAIKNCLKDLLIINNL